MAPKVEVEAAHLCSCSWRSGCPALARSTPPAQDPVACQTPEPRRQEHAALRPEPHGAGRGPALLDGPRTANGLETVSLGGSPAAARRALRAPVWTGLGGAPSREDTVCQGPQRVWDQGCRASVASPLWHRIRVGAHDRCTPGPAADGPRARLPGTQDPPLMTRTHPSLLAPGRAGSRRPGQVESPPGRTTSGLRTGGLTDRSPGHRTPRSRVREARA